MPLRTQVLNITAAAPIDEATRPELLSPGQANKGATNVRATQRGGLTKRRGFSSLTLDRYGATTRSAGRKLFSDGKVIGVIDGSQLDVYDTVKSAWKTLGRVPEADYRIIPLPSAGMSTSIADVEYCNGFFAVSYQALLISGSTATTYTFASLVNASTNAVVRPPEQIGAASSNIFIHLTSYSSRYFVALIEDVDLGTITAYYLDTNTATTVNAGWVSVGTIASDWNTLIGIKACSLSNRVAVAYVNNASATHQVTVKTLTIAGVTETVNVDTASVTPAVVDIAGSIADTLWVAWNQTTSVRIIGLDADALAVTLATVVTIVTTSAAAAQIYIAPSATAGKGRIYATSGVNSYMRGFQTTLGAAATDGATITLLSARMMSRPLQYNARYYAFFWTTSSTISISASSSQSNAIFCDWTEDVAFVRPVANVAPSLAVQPASGSSKIVAGASSTLLYTALTITKSSVGNSPSLIEFDFASTRRWQAVAHNGSVYFSGALTSMFDGKRVAEVGFVSKPATPTTALGGTGITLSTGTRYVAVYEEVDGDGNWTVSGISDPSVSTGAVANQTITVTTTPLTVSARLSTTSDQASGVRVAFYRTANGNLPPYYRVGTATNTLAANVSLADAMSDATLIAQAKLYSPNLPSQPGGALDRRGPPGLGILIDYNGMLVGATGSDVFFSGQVVSGEASWFSPILQFPVDGEGDITALAAQDGSLYVFKRRAVFAVSGEPPADNGTGGFGAPRRLAVDVGCIDPRSVVITSLGIFFQSERGIELLSRAQSVEFVGEQLEVTTAAYPICTAATLDPVANVVLFELAASESAGAVTGNGRTAVFDLSLKGWVSVDRRASYAGVADTPAQSGALVWDGSRWRYAWLETGGRVRVEQDAYYDTGSANTWATSTWEPAPYHTGVLSEQRVFNAELLVERHSAAGLTIEQDYDYAFSYPGANTKTWLEAATVSQRALPWRPKPRGSAVAFRMSDTAPATYGTGQAFTFVGISLDVAAEQGPTTGLRRLDPSLRR